jgi:hypothetical protein
MAEAKPSRGTSTVAIELVEVVLGEGTGDPACHAAIERLLSRWIVRAYLKRFGSAPEEEPRPSFRQEPEHKCETLPPEVFA